MEYYPTNGRMPESPPSSESAQGESSPTERSFQISDRTATRAEEARRSGTRIILPDSPSFSSAPEFARSNIRIQAGVEVNFYGPKKMGLHFNPPEKPLKIAFLTSIRDVGKLERVGSVVDLPTGPAYMRGTIELAFRAIHSDLLGPYVDIVAIITDDNPKDLRDTDYPALPRKGLPWIHPPGLRNQRGERAVTLTHHIPSDFRLLPLGATEERIERKFLFERQVARVMRESGADILVSDHFMARIEHLIDPDAFNLYGRVLNTHPGITRPDYPYRCMGAEPERDALLHAQGRTLNPEAAERGGRIEPHGLTGATLHLVSDEIDAGPILCDAEATPVHADDDPLSIIRNNYEYSKHMVFVHGLRHYASHLRKIASSFAPHNQLSLREGAA